MADSKKYGRTANLFDYQTMEGNIKGYYLDSNGALQESPFAAVTDYIPCSGGKFCLAKVGGVSTSICLYDNNKHFLYGQGYNTASGSDKQTIFVNTSVNATYIRFTYFYTAAPQDDLSTIMLNAGSTALPYQPYLDWLHSLRKLDTATDTITTLPADLYADGTNASADIKGNMSQTGTPTPTTPIQPQECGERTSNLFDVSTIINGVIDQNGDIVATASSYRTSDYIPVSSGNYTISLIMNIDTARRIFVALYDGNKTFTNRLDSPEIINAGLKTYTFSSGTANFIRICIVNTDTNAMLNTGSQPLPYEPYGYVLPIKSANTTTPVYLGQVQSTRKIKKYEFTGQEDWFLSTAQAGRFGLTLSDYLKSNETITSFCSHYTAIAQKSGGTAPDNSQYFYSGSDAARYIFIVDTSCSTAADFQTYLQQQYAAGTPVCVWYVLATETTGIVNEPIRKIGTYADTVSGITIPTITGKDTFDVQTTLKPSEVSLTYTGWHDATVKEWDGSQWD